MSKETVEMIRFKVFQGILGKGGLLYFCYAENADAAIQRFRSTYGDQVKAGEEVYAVALKD